jgi:hypothetical protein
MTEAVRDSFENLATKTDLQLLEAKLLFSQGELKNDCIKLKKPRMLITFLAFR